MNVPYNLGLVVMYNSGLGNVLKVYKNEASVYYLTEFSIQFGKIQSPIWIYEHMDINSIRTTPESRLGQDKRSSLYFLQKKATKLRNLDQYKAWKWISPCNNLQYM